VTKSESLPLVKQLKTILIFVDSHQNDVMCDLAWSFLRSTFCRKADFPQDKTRPSKQKGKNSLHFVWLIYLFSMVSIYLTYKVCFIISGSYLLLLLSCNFPVSLALLFSFLYVYFFYICFLFLPTSVFFFSALSRFLFYCSYFLWLTILIALSLYLYLYFLFVLRTTNFRICSYTVESRAAATKLGLIFHDWFHLGRKLLSIETLEYGFRVI
jgi:hypothetical protein